MAVLGIKTRAALRRLEQDDLVRDVVAHHDHVWVQYATGLIEMWGLHGERPRRLTLPRSGWWSGAPRERQEANGLEEFIVFDPREDGSLLPVPMRGIYRCGFMEQRLRTQRLVAALLEEGWLQPMWPADRLEADAQAVLGERRRHVLSKGFIRGQPGRSVVPPPGLVLANHLVDWGHLAGPGRISLAEAWASPQRLYWAITGLIRRRQPITRASITHKLVAGSAEGCNIKAGPLWSPASLAVGVMRGLLGLGKRPILCDPYPGCGSRVVAALALGGIVISAPAFAERSVDAVAGAALRAAAGHADARVVPDDGSITSDVGIIDLREHDVDFDVRALLDDLVERCASVVVVSDGQCDAVLMDALPGADRIRFRPRPWSSQDDAIFVLHQRGRRLSGP